MRSTTWIGLEPSTHPWRIFAAQGRRSSKVTLKKRIGCQEAWTTSDKSTAFLYLAWNHRESGST
jgi:hypothetical protein